MVIRVNAEGGVGPVPYTARCGGQAQQNISNVGPPQSMTQDIGDNFCLHEISLIGSPETDPTNDDFTGNVIFSNMEYTEYNLQQFAKLLPIDERYNCNLV